MKAKSTTHIASIQKVFKSNELLPKDADFELHRNQNRYTEWWGFAAPRGLMADEYLLPQIQKRFELDEFPFIETSTRMDIPDSDLRAKVNSLSPWAYHIKFSDSIVTTGSFTNDTVDFHRYRSKLISETVTQILGPDLGDASVLDIAGHCGVFSFDVASRGAKHVHLVELRDENLAQAKLIKEHFSIQNVSMEQQNVLQMEGKPYDVIMCLGILYHVSDPFRLLQYCYDNSSKFAVIDTVCHKEPLSCYHVVTSKDVQRSIEGDKSVEFHPTYRALIDSLRQVGFTTIYEVVGDCGSPIELYSDLTRRCLIAFKDSYVDTALRNLASAEKESTQISIPGSEVASHWPDEVTALVSQADQWIEKKEYTRAMDLINQAARILPEDPQLSMTKGSLILKSSLEEARKEFVKTIAINPGFVPAYVQLASVLVMLDRDEEVLELLTRGVANTSQNPELVELLNQFKG